MKRTFTLSLLVTVTLSSILSCNNNKSGQENTAADTTARKEETRPDTANTEAASGSISSVKISEAPLGVFPFFSLPEGLAEQNKPIVRKYDKLFFPIDGKMQALEGKVWKANIVNAKENKEEWSQPYFEKSYDDAITSAGGVRIFDGNISQEAYDAYHNEATYLGEEGSIGYPEQNIKAYLIRRQNGDDIYIQLSGSTASGYLNILQKNPFRQTITLLKAGQIGNDLEQKGKAVLYINFDTDKATLQPDGRDAVAEIVKALTASPQLRIAIHGYTDNTGDATHNLQLSKQRAETVKNEIIKAGIDAARLSSDGFGQNNPVADNSSEEGKARNRRVELVKQ